MANNFRWVPIVSLIFFRLSMLPGHCKSLMPIGRKGIGEQELLAAKHYRERIDGDFFKYSTQKKTPHEVYSSYHRGAVEQVVVDETESENEGSRFSSSERYLERLFESERMIPGGPNGQHHMSNGL